MSKRKFDETIPGGRYRTAAGQLVNANGEFIDNDGNLIGGRLPKKPSIKVRLIRDYYKFGGYKEIARLENGVKVTDKIPFTIKKEWITEKSLNEKSNEIWDKVKKKYQRKLRKAKNDDERNEIEKSIEAEYQNQLHNWLYPEETNTGGRSMKISPNNFKELAPKIYRDEFHRRGSHLNDIDLAAELDISKSTLYRYFNKCGWKMSDVRAEAMKNNF